MPSSIFGSPLRSRALILVAALGETYPSELAALLQARLLPVQRVIASLEDAGMVATRKRGQTRIVSLNTRWFAYQELYALLMRCSERPEFAALLAVRRRPRAIAKPL